MSFCTRQFRPAVDYERLFRQPMFSTTEPKAVKLRHWTKTTVHGTYCGACNQWLPPRTEHECWTLEPMPRERVERDAKR